MNYLTDPHDRKVMVAILRRAFDIARHWAGEGHLGPWIAPPVLAAKHKYEEGTILSDEFLASLDCG